jgi:hypothetical protein
VHGRGRLDVYAVGLDGVILHFDGLVWRQRDSGVLSSLEGVWCAADGQTVAVGSGGLVLNNSGELGEDTPWVPQDSGTAFSLYDVIGDGSGGAFAAGFNGIVLHYDGADWDVITTGYHDRLNAIHVNPCGEIVAGGLWGLVIRYGY